MGDVDQNRSIGTGEAIRLFDSHVIPVGPIHPVFKHRQREHVRHRAVVDHVTIGAVKVSEPVPYTCRNQLSADFKSSLSSYIRLM